MTIKRSNNIEMAYKQSLQEEERKRRYTHYQTKAKKPRWNKMTSNSKKVIIKESFLCSHLTEGFKGIDVFFSIGKDMYRLRYFQENMYLFKVTYDVTNPTLEDWTKLNLTVISKYLNKLGKRPTKNEVCEKLITELSLNTKTKEEAWSRCLFTLRNYITKIEEYEQSQIIENTESQRQYAL